MRYIAPPHVWHGAMKPRRHCHQTQGSIGVCITVPVLIAIFFALVMWGKFDVIFARLLSALRQESAVKTLESVHCCADDRY